MIAAIPGISLATIGVPTARLSNSLLGVLSRWLIVVGWIGIALTSADATHASRCSGGTAGNKCTRPSYTGSAARVLSRSSSPPNPSSTRCACFKRSSVIASIRISRPRSRWRPPWYRTTGAPGGMPAACRSRFSPLGCLG